MFNLIIFTSLISSIIFQSSSSWVNPFSSDPYSGIIVAEPIDTNQELNQTQYYCLFINYVARGAAVKIYDADKGVSMIGINNAHTARYTNFLVSGYFIPCIGGLPADVQVTNMYNVSWFLVNGYNWIKVFPNDTPGCKWKENDPKTNCNILATFVNAFKAKGSKIGIYSKQNWWTAVFGSANQCTQFASLPLWYENQDGNQFMTDYSKVAFGGWTKPYQKLYGQQTSCDIPLSLTSAPGY